MTAPDRARPPVRRPSRVDELLEAIDQALEALRSSKTLRACFPRAYAELEARNKAARTVVLAASYKARVRVRAAYYDTRRPLDNEVAERALEALGNAYGVPQ